MLVDPDVALCLTKKVTEDLQSNLVNDFNTPKFINGLLCPCILDPFKIPITNKFDCLDSDLASECSPLSITSDHSFFRSSNQDEGDQSCVVFACPSADYIDSTSSYCFGDFQFLPESDISSLNDVDNCLQFVASDSRQIDMVFDLPLGSDSQFNLDLFDLSFGLEVSLNEFVAPLATGVTDVDVDPMLGQSLSLSDWFFKEDLLLDGEMVSFVEVHLDIDMLLAERLDVHVVHGAPDVSEQVDHFGVLVGEITASSSVVHLDVNMNKLVELKDTVASHVSGDMVSVLSGQSNETGGNYAPSSSSRRGRRRKFAASSGLVRRSVRIRESCSLSSGEFPGSNSVSGVSEPGSGTHFDLGSIYSSYVLGDLSASDFRHLASSSAFIFSDFELDREFIRNKEFYRARSMGL